MLNSLVFRLLKANLFRKDRIRDMASLIIIFSVIFSFSSILQIYKDNKLNVYSKGEYDLIVQGFSETQQQEIEQLPFIQAAVPYFQIFDITLRGKERGTGVSTLAIDDMSQIDLTYFSPRMLLAHKDQDDRSPEVAISRDIAKALDLKIGDEATIVLNDVKTHTFIVSRIYESIFQSLGKNMIVIEMTDELKYDMQALNTDMPFHYNGMFIKAENLVEARNYFTNFPMGAYIEHRLQLEGISQEDERYEEAYKQLKQSYISQPIDRLEQLAIQEKMLEISPTIIHFMTLVGFILFFIFLYRENAKKLKQDLRTVAILAAQGMSKGTYVRYLWAEMTIYQIPIFIGSVLLAKVIYQVFIPNLFFAQSVLLEMSLLFLILQLFAGVLSAVVIYVVLRRRSLHLLLNQE